MKIEWFFTSLRPSMFIRYRMDDDGILHLEMRHEGDATYSGEQRMNAIRWLITEGRKDATWFSLTDRTTGTKVHEFVLGKRWHWWLIFGLLFLRLVYKYWA